MKVEFRYSSCVCVCELLLREERAVEKPGRSTSTQGHGKKRENLQVASSAVGNQEHLTINMSHLGPIDIKTIRGSFTQHGASGTNNDSVPQVDAKASNSLEHSSDKNTKTQNHAVLRIYGEGRQTTTAGGGRVGLRPSSAKSTIATPSSLLSRKSAKSLGARQRHNRPGSAKPAKSNMRNVPESKTSKIRHARPRKTDFVLRHVPKHYSHWSASHVRNILRAKIECRSKRRENRNSNALLLLGGSAKDAGITAHQLRRRCLRMSIPMSRKQAEELFRSIEGGTGATTMSLHRFLLGLFPEDYDSSRISDLRRSQTLMGISEIERTSKIGKDWQKKTQINKVTLRWPPDAMLKKLQQEIVKRGGGLAQALKRYSVIRKDEKTLSTTTIGKEEMREVITRIFRIPASDKECDIFFSCLSNNPNGRISFSAFFRKLDGGALVKGRIVPGNLGLTPSDIIGGAKTRALKELVKDDVSEVGSVDSYISLASTRVPSVKQGFGGGNNFHSEIDEMHASSYEASLSSDREHTLPSAISSRSITSARSLKTARSLNSLSSDRSTESLRSLAHSVSAAVKRRRARKKHRQNANGLSSVKKRPSSAAPSRVSRESARRSRPSSAAPSSRLSSRGSYESMAQNKAYFTLGTSGTLGGARAEKILSMAIASAAHFRRLRTLARSNSAAGVHSNRGIVS